MTLKQGQVIEGEYGYTCKILEVLTNTVLVSTTYSHTKAYEWFTESELRDLGYTWEEEKWEPEIGQMFWYLHGDVSKHWELWDAKGLQLKYRDFLGVYPTEEALDTALADIKRKLSK